jgi:protein-tyrosine phosphatase
MSYSGTAVNRITDWVYLGDIHDAANHERLDALNIGSILKLTHSDPEQPYPENIELRTVSMIDGPQNDEATMRTAVEELLELRANHEPVFVHCTAGASRSVSVAAAAISVHREIPLAEAFELVEERRPVSQPHPALVKQAKRVVEQIV